MEQHTSGTLIRASLLQKPRQTVQRKLGLGGPKVQRLHPSLVGQADAAREVEAAREAEREREEAG